MEPEQTLQIIPIVMLIVGVVKDYVDPKYLRLVAVVLGVVFAFAFEQDVTNVINGVLGGLGAIATYDISKGNKVSKQSDLEKALLAAKK